MLEAELSITTVVNNFAAYCHTLAHCLSSTGFGMNNIHRQDNMRRHIMKKHPVMNIMLLGSTGSGKSASGNTIIGVKKTFKEDFSPEAVTRTGESAQTELDGQKITVIDTVGLSDITVNITDAQTQIEKMLAPHSVDVFLLVIRLGETVTESSKVVQWIQNNFGSKFSKHTIVLFTHGDQLHKPIEDYLSKCETLRSVVDQCSGGFHVFNNKDKDPSQVTELLEKIESLRMMNAYKRYTKQGYKQTQEALLFKQYVIVGAVVGAVVGAGVGASMTGTPTTEIALMGSTATAPRSGQSLVGAIIGAIIGAVLAIVGYLLLM